MSKMGDYVKATFIAADFAGDTEEDTITNLALEILRLRRELETASKGGDTNVDIL